MRLIFMGTPDFAVPSLCKLSASRHEILAVVTNPDRPVGRGRKLQAPPIKVAAHSLGLPLLQTSDLGHHRLANHLRELIPDLFVVVAFSILPRHLLAVPTIGSVNLHPSLLPAYRGAAPIIWAVINGEAETGLTTLLLNNRVDAGDILLQHRVRIGSAETSGELELRLRELGANLLVETVDGLEKGTLDGRSQPHCPQSRAPKIGREDGRLDWEKSARVVFNQIRGTNPIPGAFTTWHGEALKIHRSEFGPKHRASPGAIVAANPREGLIVGCAEGTLKLLEVQPAGKTRMPGSAFVAGYPIAVGQHLGDRI